MAGATLALCFATRHTTAQTTEPAKRDVTADASRALAQGRPYRATRLLTPLLAGPAGGDPALRLLGARAAAGWGGWGTVIRLLATASWLDSADLSEGRALLARARVERGEDAVPDSRAALRGADRDQLGERLVTLARAYDRAGVLDSAAAVYRRAAEHLPSVADWLLLRAAGVLADSAARSELYAEISLPAAVPRIRWTDALARERIGDAAGAARVYETLGAAVTTARIRLGLQPDSATRSRIRRDLIGELAQGLAPDDARAAIGLLDQSFAPLSMAEELVVARRAATTDLAARSAIGFSRVRPLRDSDRMTYGSVLARLGKHREAIALYSAIRTPALKTQAQYQRARSILRSGTRGAAIAALRRVARGAVSDSVAAATAGYLAADLLVDDGDEEAARTAYLEVARRFPTTPHGSRAALVAAIIAFSRGELRDASHELRTLADRKGDRSEAAAAAYWAGRVLIATGDSAAARVRWQSVLERFGNSYYAIPARQRLAVAVEPVPTPAPAPAPDEAITSALERGVLLERLGLKVEARFEFDRVSREAESTPAALASAAQAYAALGFTARAYRLSLRAGERASPRLLFPIPRRADLFEEARTAGVDPLLAASIIRQESGFEPGARSVADARGLMQVVPSVGAALAKADGMQEWDAGLLYQPELNVHFGLNHLAASLSRSPHLAHALAAYNAGTRAANTWVALAGARQDPEIFIERIQYAETRDYVRRILRNLETYRALYPVTP